jgi:hypothetical protein
MPGAVPLSSTTLASSWSDAAASGAVASPALASGVELLVPPAPLEPLLPLLPEPAPATLLLCPAVSLE